MSEEKLFEYNEDKKEWVNLNLSPFALPGSTQQLQFFGQVYDLFGAICRAEQKFAKVSKGTEGQTGHQKFKYADLQTLIDATRPALLEEGVVVLQPVSTADNGQSRVTTIIAGHGGMIISHYLFDPSLGNKSGDNNLKDLGLTQTYISRYQYRQYFGLVGDDADNHPNNIPIAKPTKVRPKARAAGPAPKPKAVVKQEQEAKVEETVEQKIEQREGNMTEQQYLKLKTLTNEAVANGTATVDEIRQGCQNIVGLTPDQIRGGDVSYTSAEKLILYFERTLTQQEVM